MNVLIIVNCASIFLFFYKPTNSLAIKPQQASIDDMDHKYNVISPAINDGALSAFKRLIFSQCNRSLAESASRPYSAVNIPSSLSDGRPVRMVLLGPPGVGKGTFAAEINKLYDIPHISTGDMIRLEIDKESDLGNEFKSFANNGLLVPDELVWKIAQSRLNDMAPNASYMFDGFPRTLKQAVLLQTHELRPNIVLNLHLPDDVIKMKLEGRRVCSNKKCGKTYNVGELHERGYEMDSILPKVEGVCDKCGWPLAIRSDDSPEVVDKRLKEYATSTSPLVDFYGELKILKSFAPKKGFCDYVPILNLIKEALQEKPQE